MVSLVFGLEGEDFNPVIQELELSNCDGRNIFIPPQMSEKVLFLFLQKLLRQSRDELSSEKQVAVCRNSETRLFRIREIRYLESFRNLISITAEQEVFETYGTLTKIEPQLESFGFIRIHGSFLISITHIQSYNARCITMDDGREINIGRRYLANFRETMKAIPAIRL